MFRERLGPIIVVVIALVVAYGSAHSCPCKFRSVPSLTDKLRICYSGFKIAAAANATMYTAALIPVDNTEVETLRNSACQVVLSKSEVAKSRIWERRLCPDHCRSTPDVQIPLSVLESLQSNNGSEYADYPITCSITVQMAVSLAQASRSGKQPMHIYEVIARRAIVECKEHGNHNTQLALLDLSGEVVRRKVRSVVIWVGSVGSMKQVLNQATMLHGHDFHGRNAVVPWAATDLLYDCTAEESDSCRGHLGKYKYLPKTDMRYMKAGWRCAQRRPLRALAHVLSLFDPEYVVSLDDDTFFNFPLFLARYEKFLLVDKREQPLLMGEWQGRTGPEGHLTTQGIFSGGAGYVLGKQLLDRLHSREVFAAGHERWPDQPALKGQEEAAILMKHQDSLRSGQQMKYLSVLSEGLELAHRHCAGDSTPKTCILSTTPVPSARLGEKDSGKYTVVPIAVRLVDFCTNIMANPETCMHSDHSLGRCLIHGARAEAAAFACHSLVPPDQVPPSVHIGMCFAQPVCNITEQITCHRYKTGWVAPGGEKPVEPVRTTNRGGYYKHYSSVFDGNTTDTP